MIRIVSWGNCIVAALTHGNISVLLSGPGFRDLITRKSHIIRFPHALQNLIELLFLVLLFIKFAFLEGMLLNNLIPRWLARRLQAYCRSVLDLVSSPSIEKLSKLSHQLNIKCTVVAPWLKASETSVIIASNINSLSETELVWKMFMPSDYIA